MPGLPVKRINMSTEMMSEFLPASAREERGKELEARFEAAFPDLDFTFAGERRAAKELIGENARYLIVPLSLSFIAADFSWTPTILGGIAGGLGGFFWELADGSSASKVKGVRTGEGVAVTHQGSDFAELFVSTLGGALVGGSVGAGLTSGIDSRSAYALGLFGTLPGITICRATKQRLWPLRK